MKIGAITIGQSPRVDVTPDFLRALGAQGAPGTNDPVELIQVGALDGLSRDRIADLAPQQGAQVLVTRLRDGSEVQLDEAKILDRMQAGIASLESSGVALVALFCTGDFPEFRASVPVLRPDRLLAHFVLAVAPGLGRRGTGHDAAGGARVCAVVPSPLQIDGMRMKWSRHGLATEAEALSPYSSTPLDVEAAALRVKAHKPDLVILDCIGYSSAVKSVFARVCGVPVVLPRTVLGRAAAELAGI